MQTPTKKVKKGRKPNVQSANGFCRLCECSLKVKYGDFEKISHISTENLFRHSKGCEDKPTLQELCINLGFLVDKSSNQSERVYKSCARKIRNACELYNFIKNSLTTQSFRKTQQIKRIQTTTHLSAQLDTSDNYRQVFLHLIVAHKLRKDSKLANVLAKGTRREKA